eukprot:9539895-Karenia_brevis.AAC.1
MQFKLLEMNQDGRSSIVLQRITDMCATLWVQISRESKSDLRRRAESYMMFASCSIQTRFGNQSKEK